MKLFKVIFEGNKIVAVNELDFSQKVSIETTNVDGEKVCKSITIFATSNEAAINTASDMKEAVFVKH